jgi:hypothetical protein
VNNIVHFGQIARYRWKVMGSKVLLFPAASFAKIADFDFNIST